MIVTFSQTAYILIKIFLLVAMLTSSIAQVYLFYFIQDFFSLWSLPTVSSNCWVVFPSSWYVFGSSPSFNLFVFNLLSMQVFWLQHMLMARSCYKEFMRRLTNGKYELVQPVVYSFASGVALQLPMLLWQPMNTLLYDFDFVVMKVLGWLLVAVGMFMLMQSAIDMKECDVVGAKHVERLNPAGTEIPIPFVPKNYSRLALCVRNTIYSGVLHIFIGALFVFPITVGRLLFLANFSIANVVGAFMEEWSIQKEFPEFKGVKAQIPNCLVVDWVRFFTAEEGELQKIRESLLPLKEDIPLVES